MLGQSLKVKRAGDDEDIKVTMPNRFLMTRIWVLDCVDHRRETMLLETRILGAKWERIGRSAIEYIWHDDVG